MSEPPNQHDALVDAARNGDRDALHTLLTQHLPTMVAFLRLQIGPGLRARESVHDLAQSVCVDILRDLDKFEFRGEPSFRRWLLVCALRKIRMKHRYYHAERRDVAREVARLDDSAAASVAELYATIHTPGRIAAGREAVDRFERAFDRLPEGHRTAIILRRYVGLSWAEVATQMGGTETSVRHLASRGLARLAAALDEAGTE